jgi:LmbE family N-acetylglucosaminyl deacetylase
MTDITRRSWLSQSALLPAGVTGFTASEQSGKEMIARDKRLRVVVVGAHPDDPESSCGGTMSRYADHGHEVTAVYLTRGEAGIKGKTVEEAAAIRTAEAERACQILKARPVFAGQVDGKTEVNPRRYQEFRELIEAQNPDVVFAPWPIDSHRDHRAASLLTQDVWEQGDRRFELYYTEVDVGEQTSNFQPTHYVDITPVLDRKREACLAHISQNPGSFYGQYHEPMQRFRGMEYRCQAAEAFVSAVGNPGSCSLPV